MTIRALPPDGPAPSPCNSVCIIDQASGFCVGCFRTLDEIAEWSLLDDKEKREVWSLLAQRRNAETLTSGDGVLNRNGSNVSY